jgi:hypothetical protein
MDYAGLDYAGFVDFVSRMAQRSLDALAAGTSSSGDGGSSTCPSGGGGGSSTCPSCGGGSSSGGGDSAGVISTQAPAAAAPPGGPGCSGGGPCSPPAAAGDAGQQPAAEQGAAGEAEHLLALQRAGHVLSAMVCSASQAAQEHAAWQAACRRRQQQQGGSQAPGDLLSGLARSLQLGGRGRLPGWQAAGAPGEAAAAEPGMPDHILSAEAMVARLAVALRARGVEPVWQQKNGAGPQSA